jgi:hypothetical protein
MFTKTQTAAQLATLISPVQPSAVKSTPWKANSLSHIQFKPIRALVTVQITSTEEPTCGRWQHRLHLKECHTQLYTQSRHVMSSYLSNVHMPNSHITPRYTEYCFTIRGVTEICTNLCTNTVMAHIPSMWHMSQTYLCAHRCTGDLMNMAELCVTHSKEIATIARTFVSTVSLHFWA